MRWVEFDKELFQELNKERQEFGKIKSKPSIDVLVKKANELINYYEERTNVSVNLQDLMSTSPEKLAELQFEKLKQHALDRLDAVRYVIESNQFSRIALDKEYIAYSPAGDGYGLDSHFIDFRYETNNADATIDIQELCEQLMQLGVTAKIIK